MRRTSYKRSKWGAYGEWRKLHALNLETYQKLANATKESARETRKGNIFFSITSIATVVSVGIAAWAVLAAIEANDTAREALYLDSRPWLSVQIAPLSDLVWNAAGNANIDTVFVLKNHGKTPATNVYVSSKLLVTRGEYGRPQAELVRSCQRTRQFFERHGVEKLISELYWTFEPPVYPGDEGKTMRSAVIWGSEYEKQYNTADGIDKMWASLIGCVTYTAANGVEIEQTPFIFDLRLKKPAARDAYDLGFRRRNIPRAELTFSHSISYVSGPD